MIPKSSVLRRFFGRETLSLFKKIKFLSAQKLGVFITLAWVLATSQLAMAVTSGSNGTHDPSRMLECDGKLYIWSTGGGGMVSSDGMVWSSGSRLPFGSWVDSLFPSNQGMWAPDGIYYHGLYWLFYTVCNTHDNSNQGSCANGLWTTPTLDPKSPNYKLTDRGLVNRNIPSNSWACMDPGPFVDTADNLWIVWGGGGWTTRLDNKTGMIIPPYTATAPGNHILPSQKGEAGYIHYRAPYYYFFWNTGGCCNGTASTYIIHMARSKTLDGVYNINDNKTFYKTNGDIHGPGQIGIVTVGGVEVFTYHYYPNDRSILGVNSLTWSSDGWPVAGEQITSPLKPNGNGTGVIGSKPINKAIDKSKMQIKMIHNRISIPLPLLASGSQFTVAIVSVSGKKIVSALVAPSNGKLDVFAGDLTPGMYVISIANNNETIMSSQCLLMK